MEKETDQPQQRQQRQRQRQQEEEIDNSHAQYKAYGERPSTKKDEVASLKRLLSAFTTPLEGQDSDEVIRLKTTITRLLAKNEELRHGMSADKRRDLEQIKELRAAEEKRKLQEDFEPHYREHLEKVEQEKIKSLSLRVAELELNRAIGRPVYIVTSEPIKKTVSCCAPVLTCDRAPSNPHWPGCPMLSAPRIPNCCGATGLVKST